MRISTFKEKWENLAKENALLRFSVLVLVAGMLVEGFLLLASLDKITVHVYAPEHLKEDFEIKRNGEISSQYVEQWGLSIIPYISSFTPESIDFNLRVFLSYVHPKNYGAIETELIRLRDEIKSVGISQSFFSQEISTSKDRVSITGRQIRFVGKTVTNDELVRYDFYFLMQGERPLVERVTASNPHKRREKASDGS